LISAEDKDLGNMAVSRNVAKEEFHLVRI